MLIVLEKRGNEIPSDPVEGSGTPGSKTVGEKHDEGTELRVCVNERVRTRFYVAVDRDRERWMRLYWVHMGSQRLDLT